MKHENDEPEPLDPQAAAFLDALRGADQPRSVDRRRIHRKVLVAVAATGASAAASGGSAAAAASGAATATGAGALGVGGAGVGGAGVAAKIWIGVTLGVVAVAGGVATLAVPEAPATEEAAPAPDARAEHFDRSVGVSPAATARAPGELPAAPVPEPVPEPEPELSRTVPEASPEPERSPGQAAAAARASRPRPIPRPAPTVEARPPLPAADTLREELVLLRRAHAAANSRKFDESLGILAEHERRFPNGSLAVEREGARVIALCGAGRRAEGRRRAERFAEVHPRSPLGPRVARACAE